MERLKSLGISKFERIIYVFTFLLVVLYPVLSVFSKSTLSKVNYDLEEIKTTIKDQSKTNQSLKMKMNELASLENLENIAKEMGLTYSSENIKTIE